MIENLKKYDLGETAEQLLNETRALPDPSKSLLEHNERVLIEFCCRLASALETATAAVGQETYVPSFEKRQTSQLTTGEGGAWLGDPQSRPNDGWLPMSGDSGEWGGDSRPAPPDGEWKR